MKIYSVNDAEFKEYGRVVETIDFSELVEAEESLMEKNNG